jgi:hypothetical protein
MGVRLYNASTGRFLQVDPVAGGSCNGYDYSCQDPINKFDTDGTCWSHFGWACHTYHRYTGWAARTSSAEFGGIAAGLVRATGGSCTHSFGLRVCHNGWAHLYSRGGTTIGDTYSTNNDPFNNTRHRILHEKKHRDLQWRRYGGFFPFMYWHAGNNPCKNKYERQAGLRGGDYSC